MTLIREDGKAELVCDACDRETAGPVHAEDYEILLTDAKAEGWRTSRIEDDWRHRCPSCVKAGRPIPGKPTPTAGLFGETLPIKRKPR